MPATTPSKGKPTPKREDQRKARRRGLPHELPEDSVIVKRGGTGEPEVRDISGSGIVQDITGYGSIVLPRLSTEPEKE